MDRALAMGITFIDTANVYGGRLLGAARRRSSAPGLPPGPGMRDEVVLATKVYRAMEAIWVLANNDARLLGVQGP